MECSPPGPLSTGFSRQEYWSGLPFPSPGDSPEPGTEPSLPHCQHILYCLKGKPREAQNSPVKCTNNLSQSIRYCYKYQHELCCQWRQSTPAPSPTGMSSNPFGFRLFGLFFAFECQRGDITCWWRMQALESEGNCCQCWLPTYQMANLDQVTQETSRGLILIICKSVYPLWDFGEDLIRGHHTRQTA